MKILALDVVDEVITCPLDGAYECGRRLGREEGVLAGISSGAALHAACLVAAENPGKTVVVILPDTGSRYLSTQLFEGETV